MIYTGRSIVSKIDKNQLIEPMWHCQFCQIEIQIAKLELPPSKNLSSERIVSKHTMRKNFNQLITQRLSLTMSKITPTSNLRQL